MSTRLALTIEEGLLLVCQLDGLLIVCFGGGGDISLPEFREIRKAISAPVIVICHDLEPRTRVEVLLAGANDCLTKAFFGPELIVRIYLQWRRYGGGTMPSSLEFVGEREVVFRGGKIRLTRRECKLLRVLAARNGELVSRQVLLQEVWQDPDAQTRRVDLYVSRVRNKLRDRFGENLITSVYGLGYQLSI